jgi:hypothetical protein
VPEAASQAQASGNTVLKLHLVDPKLAPTIKDQLWNMFLSDPHSVNDTRDKDAILSYLGAKVQYSERTERVHILAGSFSREA